MADNTIYLITGANRGIGLAITNILVARPNTTVIATSRKPAASLTTSFPAERIHPTSRLVPILLDEADPAVSSSTLAARLAAAEVNGGEEKQPTPGSGIDRVDVVIANAGAMASATNLLATDPDTDMRRDFEVNALGPAKLFRAVWPLFGLEADGAGKARQGEKKQKKFVLMSSTIGSIGLLERESLPGVGYGMSKAAANWWAKKASVELKGKGLVVGILHPGWVQTDMGQQLADALGVKEPAISVEQSAKGCVEQIDNWTPEKAGRFLTYNGAEVPW